MARYPHCMRHGDTTSTQPTRSGQSLLKHVGLTSTTLTCTVAGKRGESPQAPNYACAAACDVAESSFSRLKMRRAISSSGRVLSSKRATYRRCIWSATETMRRSASCFKTRAASSPVGDTMYMVAPFGIRSTAENQLNGTAIQRPRFGTHQLRQSRNPHLAARFFGHCFCRPPHRRMATVELARNTGTKQPSWCFTSARSTAN